MSKKDNYPKNYIKVLDHGFVRIVDSMGDDSAIVQKARVSYGDGTKKPSDDRTLIRYLIRNKHTSPLEGVTFKFHIKAPIFVYRQWHRHRTWSYNEMSGRYSVLPEECYVPNEENVTTQDPDNKQGGTNIVLDYNKTSEEYGFKDEMYEPQSWAEKFAAEQKEAKLNYYNYIDSGMRRELARINQPVSQYSEMYATVDLHNLFHFLKLRMDSHAQWEIRQYANALFEIIKPIVPEASQAFEDYILNSVTLSALDTDALFTLLAQIRYDFDLEETITDISEEKFSNKRERTEFIAKIKELIDY